MASLEDLPMHFQKLQEESLPAIGIRDSSVGRIIAARLLIERLGESDANYWWDSQVLTEFGQGRLKDTVPRTTTFAQIDLATKVGRKVEREIVEGESVTLFDLGRDVEREIERELDNIENEAGFEYLHDLDLVIGESGWTDELVESNGVLASNGGRPYEIGEIAIDAMTDEEIRDEVVSELILGYGSSTQNDLRVPYYRVKE